MPVSRAGCVSADMLWSQAASKRLEGKRGWRPATEEAHLLGHVTRDMHTDGQDVPKVQQLQVPQQLHEPL